jgi:hypothetical protein
VTGGDVKAFRDGVDRIQVGKNFTEALASFRGSLRALTAEMIALNTKELK